MGCGKHILDVYRLRPHCPLTDRSMSCMGMEMFTRWRTFWYMTSTMCMDAIVTNTLQVRTTSTRQGDVSKQVSHRGTLSRLHFFGCYKLSDWRLRACAINVKSSMCNETTKYLWYKYYGLLVRMYITSLQSYLSQINTRQTSFEAYFDSKP